MSVKTSFQKEALRYWHATFSGRWATPLHTWVLTGLSELKKTKKHKNKDMQMDWSCLLGRAGGLVMF